MGEASSKSTEKRSFARELFDYVEIFVIAACIVLSLYSFVTRLCKVSGASMDTTLADGQMLVVSNIGYEPEYGDIIVFHQTSDIPALNEAIVKRVIATEGQTVDIDFNTWTVTVTDTDGTARVLNEDYMYLDVGYATRRAEYDFPVTVPEGKVFVMGDNRNNSLDSRSNYIGFVDTRRILGKAIFRLTPFDKIGKVG